MSEKSNIYQDYNNLMRTCYALEDERDLLKNKLNIAIEMLNAIISYEPKDFPERSDFVNIGILQIAANSAIEKIKKIK